jgi:hypothetical protein
VCHSLSCVYVPLSVLVSDVKFHSLFFERVPLSYVFPRDSVSKTHICFQGSPTGEDVYEGRAPHFAESGIESLGMSPELNLKVTNFRGVHLT